MGLAYNTYLTSNKIYGCKTCKAHLSNHEDIISRVSHAHPTSIAGSLWPPAPWDYHPTSHNIVPLSTRLRHNVSCFADGSLQSFRGQHGKAYLFNNVVNFIAGEPNERSMTTGRHIVRDISCRQCKEIVGWTYDKAYEPSEKYKEGKFILEAELLCNVS